MHFQRVYSFISSGGFDCYPVYILTLSLTRCVVLCVCWVFVCSTWHGPPWSPTQALQSVLLSIQTLMNEKPYHNEPGFERVSENPDIRTHHTICSIENFVQSGGCQYFEYITIVIAVHATFSIWNYLCCFPRSTIRGKWSITMMSFVMKHWEWPCATRWKTPASVHLTFCEWHT